MLSRSPTHSRCGRSAAGTMSARCGELHLLQHALAVQRFHLGGAGLDGVDLVAAGALLDQRALQDALGARAPELQLDAVFLGERGDQHAHVVGLVIDE